MSVEDLLIEDIGEVRVLKLNRPHRLNAFDASMSGHLIDALTGASRDDSVRAVVITGCGRGFCSGLDLSRFTDGSLFPSTRHARLDELEWVGRLIEGIVHNDKPVIAAMNGVAAGAGLSMALACDFRYVAQTAKLTTGYIRRALSPDAGMTYLLPRIVGHAMATDLILTGRDVTADEALRIGLVHQVVAPEELVESALEFAQRLAAGPPIATTLSKRLLISSYEATLVQQLKAELQDLKQCLETEDVREGITAMMEKRVPKFQGN
ncbi:enoyl-CoA hydratase-related protein [Alicyclobacillus fastidiosus]|uniref:Enoyl-CoA hydratase-related protein n=1 Tax=Alicyclobacillus fastidiosus TaxID=392011 RepID=A0ABY6ZD87_9BACL|nr:enoyl-CoA hydratase-related protein [Alicyclobacillus fastidiosus]WAH40091.1 enoyl-CoA hydratase-related protein [Alicyclobacillus fastidiosus]GMA61416.1 enoyl-CoA hydratase [Alicyclobacillus fastidiosus]